MAARIPCHLLMIVACAVLTATAEPAHPTKVYWGDTHVHTYLSADAFGMGTRVTPDTAYRYALGEQVTADNGQFVKIRRPLDFLMVSDHAENLGMHRALIEGRKIGATPAGKAWMKTITPDQASLRDAVLAKTGEEQQRIVAALGRLKGDWKARYIDDDDFRRNVWQEVIATAEKYNDPGTFTAFIGFEWTANPMIHRNVMFADDARQAREVMPLSFNDTGDPEGLWRYLAVAADGSADPVGNTVNLKDASYSNSIGETGLTTVWVDPEFDSNQLAFYYVRVLEIPTPRWTDYDAARLGTKHPASIPVTTQERAYTSPIWYTPRDR